MFRVKGDNVDILPTSENTTGIRVTFFDDEIETIKKVNIETQMSEGRVQNIYIFPLYDVYYEEDEISSIEQRILKEHPLTEKVQKDIEKITVKELCELALLTKQPFTVIMKIKSAYIFTFLVI